MMKYKLKVYNIWEYGQRKDAAGNPHQEDSIYPLYDKATEDDRLFILCDGMGGHDAGEVASSTVCEAMSRSVLKVQPESEGEFTDDMFRIALADAFADLDEKDTRAEKKMGTTMTFLKLHNQGCTIAHMGDSRVYHIRPGREVADTKILFQTRDHSLVNDLIAVGELTEEEAKNSRQKNVITRAMQPHMEYRPKADIYHTADIRPGDYFYLCSDGMLENMEELQICYNFSDITGSDEEKVERLTKATQENRDNHTAIIVHIQDVFGSAEETEHVFVKATNVPEPLIGEVHDNEISSDDGIRQPVYIKWIWSFVFFMTLIAAVFLAVRFVPSFLKSEDKIKKELDSLKQGNNGKVIVPLKQDSRQRTVGQTGTDTVALSTAEIGIAEEATNTPQSGDNTDSQVLPATVLQTVSIQSFGGDGEVERSDQDKLNDVVVGRQDAKVRK